MVKSWILSSHKPTRDASRTGASRVGTRAFGSAEFRRNLLASLRQKIVRRWKPAAITASQSPRETPLAIVMEQTLAWTLSSSDGKQSELSSEPVNEESNEGSDKGELDGVRDGKNVHESTFATTVIKKAKKKDRRPTADQNRWESKLPNPVKKHQDRVYLKRKEPLFIGSTSLSTILTDSRQLFLALLAHILSFLDPLVPAQTISYVSKSTAVGVKVFYELYYRPPRPRGYLMNQLLENHHIPARIMDLLSINDRVRASGSCWSFYKACNALPLQFNGKSSAQKFLVCYNFPQTSRIFKRFRKTPALLFNETRAEDVVTIIQMLERGGGNEEDDSDDDIDCFASVQAISLQKVCGFSDTKGTWFMQLLQTLFMSHVSSRLHTIEFTGLKLEDLQFKHLAKLWRDAQFPTLRRLNLANNAFSCRFVRDWSWSFENSRFLKLEAIDVSNTEMTTQDLQRFIVCLSTTPVLQHLNISHNLCSFATVQKLREQIEARALRALKELHCVAITVDETAMSYLLEVFQIVPPCCPNLQVVDVSGNPLSNPKAATQLARIFTSNSQLSSCWPDLKTLNLSSTSVATSRVLGNQLKLSTLYVDALDFLVLQLGDEGFQTVSTALLQGRATRIQHLDVSSNIIQASIDTFARALVAGKLPHLRLLAMADNELGALEFQALGTALATNCCPELLFLNLSANFARGEGIARFCPFLLSPPAQHLWSLDLSNNDIPHRGLLRLSETLACGNCKNLHELNLSLNLQLKAIVSFLDLIRKERLPSLTILRVGYAQSRSEGHYFVQDTRRRQSVQDIRRLKQLNFEDRLTAIQLDSGAKTERNQIRCRHQTQQSREVCNHLEAKADDALHRYKKPGKSSQLCFRQEIMRHKQQHAHARLSRKIDMDVHAV